MDKNLAAWVLFSLYLLVTIVLALRGMKKTTGFSSFALGKRDMGPWLVGITLASSIASSATFIINPGFVYQHGLSAFLHFAVAAPLGFLTALFLFSKKFRALGEKNNALTLPHWIRNRYNSPAMGTYFAILNLVLSITFVVLIVKGSALVMQHTLGTDYITSLVIIVGVVFSYIMLGGTYAHAYTNSFQGIIMFVVALMIGASGIEYFSSGISAFFTQLKAIDPNLAMAANPASPLFSNFWEVYICGFVISLGLVCQPHILMKPMYLKSEKQVTKSLVICSVVSLVFAFLLIAGLYARLSLNTPVTQDAVMAVYISQAFTPLTSVVISVALLAAGMSTLDGILVGASTIAANDIMLGPLGEKTFKFATQEARERAALKFSRWILVAIGVIAFVIALDPPKLVGLFAQAGIYGLTAASLAPIAAGLLLKNIQSNHVFAAAIVGPLVHFAIYFHYKFKLAEVLNPAVSASIGIAASVVVLTGLHLFSSSKVNAQIQAEQN